MNPIYVGTQFTCEECGKGFYLPLGGTVELYTYKILKYADGGKYHMFCSWTCYKRGKAKKAQDKILNKGDLSGHSATEAENWLKWAGEKVPDKSLRLKKNPAPPEKVKVTCATKVNEKYDAILEMVNSGMAWKHIRIEAGMLHWGKDMIRSTFMRIKKEKESK